MRWIGKLRRRGYRPVLDAPTARAASARPPAHPPRVLLLCATFPASRPEQVEAQIEHLLSRQAALQEQRERLQRMRAAEARAPRADWLGTFAWDGRVQQLLGDVFGLRSFRPLQREVINATLQVGGCCTAPTGARRCWG